MLAAEFAVGMSTSERDTRYEYNAPKVWVVVCPALESVACNLLSMKRIQGKQNQQLPSPVAQFYDFSRLSAGQAESLSGDDEDHDLFFENARATLGDPFPNPPLPRTLFAQEHVPCSPTDSDIIRSIEIAALKKVC